MKKTSVHLVRGSAFADVHPWKPHLLLTIKGQEAHSKRREFEDGAGV